jgi:hypothetical protein
MLPQAGAALVKGMGLTSRNVSLLIRVGWVIAMSVHAAYVCGLLAVIGLTGQPFARASDLAEIQRNLRVSARINLQAEIRAQGEAFCSLTGHSRDVVGERIEKLRIELKSIEPNAEIPVIVCP